MARKYHKVNDGWFTYYVNVETGERKFQLEPGDIEVPRKLDDFCAAADGGRNDEQTYTF